jgi:hypothetical protein
VQEEPLITNPFGFYWACLKDAFGKAWWIVGVVTVILPFLNGFIHEDEPLWEKYPFFNWLHEHADFTIPFWLAVMVCFWRIIKAPYDLLMREKNRADSMSEKLVAIEKAVPKIKVYCRPDDPATGGGKPNGWNGGSSVFYRLGVEAGDGSAEVKNCQGRLIAIRKQGNAEPTWSGDKAILTFAPGEKPDAEGKLIPANSTEYLDVLMFLFGPAINFLGIMPGTKPPSRGWAFLPPLHEIFDVKGEYILTVEIVANGMPAHKVDLKFTYSDPVLASSMEKIN